MSNADELATAIKQCTAEGGPMCDGCPMYKNYSLRDRTECLKEVARSARRLIILKQKEIEHLQIQVSLMSENYTIKYAMTAEGYSMTAWPKGEHEATNSREEKNAIRK